ncbi:hypothetical protein GDO86_006555 [Hymenochirus boettgeri]|nr:hypothetical protein GDO86_006555 [Hymenochirus boettgeri]
MIIDLTCTTRYYSPEELPKSLKYAKIFTAGQEVPNDQNIYEFKNVVKQFLEENSDNDKLIGVHCTHGLNRTGYLVCRYLIDVLGMVPTDAIEKFNKSRGHCIERENYIHDLTHGKKRNNAGLDIPKLSQARQQQKRSNINNHSLPLNDHRHFKPVQSWKNSKPGFPLARHSHQMPNVNNPLMHPYDPRCFRPAPFWNPRNAQGDPWTSAPIFARPPLFNMPPNLGNFPPTWSNPCGPGRGGIYTQWSQQRDPIPQLHGDQSEPRLNVAPSGSSVNRPRCNAPNKSRPMRGRNNKK